MEQVRKERKRPTQRKRRRLAAVMLPAALLSIAATGYVILKADEVVAAGIGCYDAATEDANVAVVSTTGADPVKVCTELWARGDIGSSPDNVPAMTACINSGGAVAVFPTDEDDVCTRLGLQPLPDGYSKAARSFAKMRDDMHRQLYKAGTHGGADETAACLDEDTSLDIATSVLEKHGFDDWTTEIAHWTTEIAQGDYGERRCMNEVGFEDADKTVLIIPSEPGIIPWHLDPAM
jgi:hypothetical protein